MSNLWSSLLFLIVLLLSNLVFLIRLDRRSYFVLRLAVSVLAGWALSAYVFTFREDSLVLNGVAFTIALAATVPIARFCFVISWSDALFCAVAGYSVQFIQSTVNEFIIRVFSPSIGVFMYLRFPITLIILVGAYFLFGRQIQTGQNLDITKWRQMLLLVAAILTEILLCNALRQFWIWPTLVLNTACSMLLLLVCSIVILALQFSLLRRKTLANELEVVNQMWRRAQVQYELSKETIDSINRKCHDMRHQIRQIGRSEHINPEAIRQMEHSIDIYDSLYKTGNQALDTILAEKALFCQDNGIAIDCMADGEKLGFMDDTDIYSLFGNIIENTIYAVSEVPEEQRTIGLNIVAHGELLSIRQRNAFSGEVTMKNGLPVTRSRDTANHGIGTRSISMIVQKYGGTVSFQARDGIFRVNILIPLPSGAQETSHEAE